MDPHEVCVCVKGGTKVRRVNIISGWTRMRPKDGAPVSPGETYIILEKERGDVFAD